MQDKEQVNKKEHVPPINDDVIDLCIDDKYGPGRTSQHWQMHQKLNNPNSHKNRVKVLS